MFRSSNPTLKRVTNLSHERTSERADYKGITIKAFFYLGLAVLSAVISAYMLFSIADVTSYMYLLVIAVVAALVCALVASFAPQTAMVSGSLYCIAEGFLVGFISAIFGAAYQGIIFMALLATALTFGVMLFLYRSGTVRVTNRFRRIMFCALITIVVTQLAYVLLNLIFGWGFGQNYVIQLLVTVVMIVVASLMILIDLDNINNCVQNGLPKKYEWMAAFGIVVTLIWLYIQFLRLFAIIFSRR